MAKKEITAKQLKEKLFIEKKHAAHIMSDAELQRPSVRLSLLLKKQRRIKALFPLTEKRNTAKAIRSTM